MRMPLGESKSNIRDMNKARVLHAVAPACAWSTCRANTSFCMCYKVLQARFSCCLGLSPSVSSRVYAWLRFFEIRSLGPKPWVTVLLAMPHESYPRPLRLVKTFHPSLFMKIVVFLWRADSNAEFAFSRKPATGPRAPAELDRTVSPRVHFARPELTSRRVACSSIESTSRAVNRHEDTHCIVYIHPSDRKNLLYIFHRT